MSAGVSVLEMRGRGGEEERVAEQQESAGRRGQGE